MKVLMPGRPFKLKAYIKNKLGAFLNNISIDTGSKTAGDIKTDPQGFSTRQRAVNI
ncbi:MAG: hypothetical protein AABY51_07490 [Deltaproteobacteria bacterium]